MSDNPVRRNEILLFILILAGAFACTYSPIWDRDSFWHIAFGKNILENRALVRTEPFSFVTEGKPITDLSWLPHAVIGAIYGTGGFTGLELLTSFLGLITALFMAKSAKLSYGLLAFALYFSFFFNIFKSRIRLRPEGFSLVLFAALIYILLLYQKDRLRFKPFVLLLFLLWTQVHPSWIYGFIAIPFFILDKHRSRFDLSFLKDSFYMLILPAAALFINPYFYKPVFFPFTSFIAMKQHPIFIAEWAKLDLLDTISTPFIIFAVLAVIFSLYAIMKKEESVFMFLFATVQLVFLLMWTRYLSFAFIALLPFALRMIHDVLERFQRWRKLFTATAFLLLCLPFLNLFTYQPTEQFLENRFPNDEAGFLLANSIHGNILSEYETGGFLEFKTYPDCKIFIDGRFFDFLPYYEELLASAKNYHVFHSFARSYPFEIAVLPYYSAKVREPSSNFQRNFISLCFPQEEWARVYYGFYGTVFLKRIPKYEKVIKEHEYNVLLPYDDEFIKSRLAEGTIQKEELEKEVKRAAATNAKFLLERK